MGEIELADGMIDVDVRQVRLWRCLAGWNVKHPCGGASSFGGEDGRSRGIVGRGMERRSFALTWREVYDAYPVTWLGCLHFHRMYGGLVGFCRCVLLTAVEKSDGAVSGKRHTLLGTEAQRSGA